MNILSSISYTPPLYNAMLRIAADTISAVDPRILSVVAGVGLGIVGSQLFLQSNNQRPQIETSLENTGNSPAKSSWFQNKWNGVNWKYVGAGVALAGLGLSSVAVQALASPSQKPQVSPIPQSELNSIGTSTPTRPPFQYDHSELSEPIKDMLAIEPDSDGYIDTYDLYQSKYIAKSYKMTCAAFKFLYENPNYAYTERRSTWSPVFKKIESQEDLEKINKSGKYTVMGKFRTYEGINAKEIQYTCKQTGLFNEKKA